MSEAMQIKEVILSLPYRIKIETLEDALKENEFGIFFGLSKILLDAPLSEGGVSTEDIEAIRIKFNSQHKDNVIIKNNYNEEE